MILWFFCRNPSMREMSKEGVLGLNNPPSVFKIKLLSTIISKSCNNFCSVNFSLNSFFSTFIVKFEFCKKWIMHFLTFWIPKKVTKKSRCEFRTTLKHPNKLRTFKINRTFFLSNFSEERLFWESELRIACKVFSGLEFSKNIRWVSKWLLNFKLE